MNRSQLRPATTAARGDLLLPDRSTAQIAGAQLAYSQPEPWGPVRFPANSKNRLVSRLTAAGVTSIARASSAIVISRGKE